MNLNEAIETLNYIVKENPDKKTGLYTACDVVANYICNVIPVDVKITAEYDFSDTYKVVEVEEEYYNGTFPIQETNRYLIQIHSVTIWEEEPYEKKQCPMSTEGRKIGLKFIGMIELGKITNHVYNLRKILAEVY